jgi:hypothetical protein
MEHVISEYILRILDLKRLGSAEPGAKSGYYRKEEAAPAKEEGKGKGERKRRKKRKESERPVHTFCPAEYLDEVAAMVELHLCSHYGANAKAIHFWAAKKMCQYCVDRFSSLTRIRSLRASFWKRRITIWLVLLVVSPDTHGDNTWA